MPWLKKGNVKDGGVKDLSTELSARIFLRKIIKCKIWRVRISGKAVGTCHLSWIVYLWGDRCASWPPPASTSAQISPSNARICCLRNRDLWRRKSGFVGSEIKFCGAARMSEAFRRRQLFSFQCSLFKTVSQSTLGMKIKRNKYQGLPGRFNQSPLRSDK